MPPIITGKCINVIWTGKPGISKYPKGVKVNTMESDERMPMIAIFLTDKADLVFLLFIFNNLRSHSINMDISRV